MNGTQPASVLIARASHTILLTCSADGRSHQVTDELMAAGLRARTGRYRAVCGHTVTATAMLTPDGRPCPDCAVVAAAPNPSDCPQRSGRHRRPGLLLAPAPVSMTPTLPSTRPPGWNGRTPAAGGPESTPSSSGPPASHPSAPLRAGS